jgi:hypothetical protein
LWKLKNHELLEKVEGERSSKTIGQTYKHTCRMIGTEGDTCTLKETHKDCCFVMHMLTNTNKKYQETFGRSEGTFTNLKNPTMDFSFFVEIVNHTTFMSKHLTKLKRKDFKYRQNALRN